MIINYKFWRVQGLTSCLAFTVETPEDFADGWLPTLDFKLRANAQNQIEYSFYEKPMASNRCLQADTALNQNCLIRSLRNEVMRRLDSFSGSVGMEEKTVALDIFSQKLLNSGHKVATIRSILLSGIKGYKRRVSRCLAENIPLHRSAGQSADKRRRNKLLARAQWFRSPGQDEEADDETHSHTTQGAERHGGGQGKSSKKEYKPEQKELRTSTVLFVEFSKGGNLQKQMRDGLDRITPMLGFKVRVPEKGGTPLGSLLSNVEW